MKKPLFDKEIEAFLGKYEIVEKRDDYDLTNSIGIRCEDGRLYEQESYGYGLDKNPYEIYDKAMKSILQKVKDDYSKNIPYMDKKMRELGNK